MTMKAKALLFCVVAAGAAVALFFFSHQTAVPASLAATPATPVQNKATTQTSSLGISVEGIAISQGTIKVALCDQDNFLKQCALSKMEKATADAPVHFLFDRVTPGRYAVMAFHDQNDNGKLDRAPNGIPLEGYGFSRNAKGNYGPPSFDDAALDLKEGQTEIKIDLVY